MVHLKGIVGEAYTWISLSACAYKPDDIKMIANK
jgi:hypothetical protein